ncbi:MAG: helix-turn-helix transcriptional regulator [Lewinellaceae bacterium]|nr:helix-turn-helix transcriptional regulator [Lewinellaceae bacterium]
MEFGMKMRVIRIKRNLTREALADILGISVRTYQKIENGQREPTISELKKISDCLSITLEELIQFE